MLGMLRTCHGHIVTLVLTVHRKKKKTTNQIKKQTTNEESAVTFWNSTFGTFSDMFWASSRVHVVHVSSVKCCHVVEPSSMPLYYDVMIFCNTILPEKHKGATLQYIYEDLTMLPGSVFGCLWTCSQFFIVISVILPGHSCFFVMLHILSKLTCRQFYGVGWSQH